MWFKLTYSLRDTSLLRKDNSSVSFPLPSGKKGKILLWNKTFENSSYNTQLCCSALIQIKLKPNLESMFTSLLEGILPQDEPPVVELPYKLGFNVAIDEMGKIPEKYAIPLDIMPRAFQSRSKEIRNELSNLIKNFFTTFRWVLKISGPHNPYSFVDFQFSQNKEAWESIPASWTVSIVQKKPIVIGKEKQGPIKKLWIEGSREPLGHELIREAQNIFSSNPRSALLIGCSALETGLKKYIAFGIPKSEILLEEIPSPPVEKMIKQILPEIHKALNLDSLDPFIEKDKEKYLRKWIFSRNQVAHGRKTTIDIDKLDEFLKFIQMLLYKLDSFQGHDWAKSHISHLRK